MHSVQWMIWEMANEKKTILNIWYIFSLAHKLFRCFLFNGHMISRYTCFTWLQRITESNRFPHDEKPTREMFFAHNFILYRIVLWLSSQELAFQLKFFTLETNWNEHNFFSVSLMVWVHSNIKQPIILL